MARPSYGTQVKNRAKVFLTALVNYANGDLLAAEKSLDALQPHLQTLWQTPKRLIVKTKVRFLESLTSLAFPDEPLNGTQIKEVLNRLKDFIEILEDNRLTPSGSDTWHFTLNLWCDRHSLEANLRQLDIEWESRRPNKSKPTEEQASESVDIWQSLFLNALEAQKYNRLTTNPLTYRDGFTFDFYQLYIPQQLVKHRSILKESDSEEIDLTKSSIFIEDFLKQILEKPHPRHLAIVGDPGTGKTTLLQKIAHHLCDATPFLPLWVSLADLDGKTLEQYLLQDWLSLAKRQVNSHDIEAFKELFYQGRVWLLLDALDEMPINGNIALATLARQFKTWIGEANIILSCRVNVWDNGKNALYDFEAYSPLGFTYCNFTGQNQVAEFITRWFQDKPSLGYRLKFELNSIGRKRIKDAVKSPLRLALLCYIWSVCEGKFPGTLTSLYQQFTEAIYEWKQEKFNCSIAQRDNLNQKLGELAIKAIALTETKFRLPHHLAVEVLDEANTGFLTLALELGWLKPVANRYGRNVYAFYHPTFQEYFAASLVKDWRYFLPQEGSQNCPLFDPAWQEVLLFWIGRNDVPKTEKEAFINYLISFQDDCGGFYSYKAYFLAGLLISEFSESLKAKEIVAQLVQWRFGKYNKILQQWETYNQCIAESARSVLVQTDRPTAVFALEHFIQTVPHLFVRWQAAYSLGKVFAFGNQVAIATLVELINTCYSPSLQIKIAETLGKIIPNHEVAVEVLTNIINTIDSLTLKRKAAYTLGKISSGNELALSTLKDLIASTPELTLQREAMDSLIKLTSDVEEENKNSELKLKEKKVKNKEKKRRRPQDLDKAMSALENHLLTEVNQRKKLHLAGKLGRLNPNNQVAINILISLLTTSDEKHIRQVAASHLKKIIQPHQIAGVIKDLKDCSANNECYDLLWEFSQQLSYSQFYQAWNQML